MACGILCKYKHNNMKRGYFILIAVIVGILLLQAAGATTYCCEKTTSGAWCQNANSESKCDANFRKIPASCDATSYCKPGTCINGQEGICMSNTPEIVCEKNYGFWSEQPKASLPQCQLGCCLIGDQAAFTTQVSCNRMSALYGLQINWQSNLNNELDCLASANPRAKGACVYSGNYVKTCTFTTKQDCQTMAKNSAYSNVTFHSGYLCTAQELGANCAKTTQTKCDSQDDVRYVDTCGNMANIYDSSKANDETYWTKIQEPSCGNKKGNKNSASCGDCDYLSGSMCKQKDTLGRVDSGNNICKDLDCVDYRGPYSSGAATASNYPKHGESWCATDTTNTDNNAPGSTYFKLACYNGEVTQEECDSTRQKICAETIVNHTTDFKTANCKVNLWQSCTSQNNSDDCEDINARDCAWKTWNGYYFTDSGLKNDGGSGTTGMCVPKYPPGFNRDTSNNVIGGEVCGQASSVCYVKYEKAVGGEWKCTDNCSCLDSSWQSGLNSICTQIGDCGTKKNYIGSFGYKYSDIIKITDVSNG